MVICILLQRQKLCSKATWREHEDYHLLSGSHCSRTMAPFMCWWMDFYHRCLAHCAHKFMISLYVLFFSHHGIGVASWLLDGLTIVKLPNQLWDCLISYELGHTSCEVFLQLWSPSTIVRWNSLTVVRFPHNFSLSMNFVLFCSAAILMASHCSAL